MPLINLAPLRQSLAELRGRSEDLRGIIPLYVLVLRRNVDEVQARLHIIET